MAAAASHNECCIESNFLHELPPSVPLECLEVPQSFSPQGKVLQANYAVIAIVLAAVSPYGHNVLTSSKGTVHNPIGVNCS